MDINQLEVLVTVAREKSFSRAAEILGISLKTLHNKLNRMRELAGGRSESGQKRD